MKILVFLFCLCFYIYCCCYSIFRHSSYSFAAVMMLKIRGVLSFLSHVHSRRKHERFFILNNMRCFRFFRGVCLFVIFFSFMYKILLYEYTFNTNFCKIVTYKRFFCICCMTVILGVTIWQHSVLMGYTRIESTSGHHWSGYKSIHTLNNFCFWVMTSSYLNRLYNSRRPFPVEENHWKANLCSAAGL